jgi:hypothetical protein
MKNFFLAISILLTFLTSCSLKEDKIPFEETSFKSNIIVDNNEFKPAIARVTKGTSDLQDELSLVFSLEKGVFNTSTYETLVFRIHYPKSSTIAPDGVYQFGIGEIGKVLFAQGSYSIGSKYFVLAGYSVKINSLLNDKYKIEFQNIEAVDGFSIQGQNPKIIIISGTFEGKIQSY